MNDEALAKLLREIDESPPPDFERLVTATPRRARVRLTAMAVPIVIAVVALLVLVTGPQEAPPFEPGPASTVTLLRPVVPPIARGPDLFEGERIAEGILGLPAPETARP